MDELILGTKADTLLALRKRVTHSYIEEGFIVYADDFLHCPKEQAEKVKAMFAGQTIIVRSSCQGEDNLQTSNAGHYESVPDVNADDTMAIENAITRVLRSYMEKEEDVLESLADRREQVLIQRQTQDLCMSGVVFTRDIVYNRPYYMVTYDEGTNVNFVTSGKGGKTRWIAKNVSQEFLEDSFVTLLEAVSEIEGFFDYITALDIEFGMKEDGTVVIFQVRPLIAAMNVIAPMTDREFKDTKAFAKCNYLDTFHILSDKAFWNPAQAIGLNPRPLDYSLYRELMTAHIWSLGLQPLGYQPVKGELMQKVGNRPYISVNYTMQGLSPAGLSDELFYRLREYYEAKLKANKSAHDNIEFELIFNCYDFATDERLKELLDYGFSEEEILQLRNLLYDLSIQTLLSFSQMCEEDDASIEEMIQIREALQELSPLAETNIMKMYRYIGQLLASIKEHGTPQYVRQARCAYIAKSFCHTLVEKGYIPEDEMDAFLAGIPTVMTEFEHDLEQYRQDKMTRQQFLQSYGHMRLDSYDIRSETFESNERKPAGLSKNSFAKCDSVRSLNEKSIRKALEDAGLRIDVETLLDFIIKTKQNSARYKYECKKSLSLILDMITHLGEILGIAKEDLSYLEIQDLLSYHSRDSYIQIIESRRNMYHANMYLVLPDVIFGVGDMDVIDMGLDTPAFITGKVVEAQMVDLDACEGEDLTGKIVLARQASPAYDWIFEKGIAGYITKYGSAASHMAIRCAELGIPAAIGCGSNLYERIRTMKMVRLDCEKSVITEVSMMDGRT